MYLLAAAFLIECDRGAKTSNLSMLKKMTKLLIASATQKWWTLLLIQKYG